MGTYETWWVHYDISNGATRRKAANLLSSHGYRSLYSGFELAIKAQHFERLHIALSKRLSVFDLLLAIPVCDDCLRFGFGAGIEASLIQWDPA